MKLILLIITALALGVSSAFAGDGIITITTTGFSTNEIQLAANQSAKLLYITGEGLGESGSPMISFVKDGKYFNLNTTGAAVAGPATLGVYVLGGPPEATAMATIEVLPSAYPPDKAVVVGPHSGPVKVTLEMSTDLVNWTMAPNGSTHTNSPESRFFRIKLDKEVPQ